MNRLHPAMFAVMVVPFLQRFGTLVILLLVTSRGRDIKPTLFVLFAGLFISLLASSAHYFTTKYGIVGEKLEFSTGWIWTKHKVVPLERIQSVHIEQNLVHRLFKVAQVRVDTGVTNKAEEVQIAAIAYDEAQRLRHRLLQRVQVPTSTGVSFEAPTTGPDLFHLGVGELAMHGFAHNRWFYVVGFVFGLAEYAGGEENFFRVILRFYQVGTADQIVRIVFSVIAVLLAGWLVSIGFSLTQFYGFTIHRHPKGISIDRGLFTRRQTVVPLNRVSGIEIHANFLMRWLGMSSLSVQILGSKHDEEGGGRMMVSPWVQTARLEEMVRMVMPQATTKPGGWRLVPSRSIARHFVSALIAYAFIAGLFFIAASFVPRSAMESVRSSQYFMPIAVGVGALLLLGTVVGVTLRVLTSRARITETTVEQQSGWLDRKWMILPLARMQMAELESSRIQRWFKLRSVQITAPAMTLTTEDLDPTDAEAIFDVARVIRRSIKSRGV